MAPPDLSDTQKTCPRCHQPLTPNVKFCETCGAKIEPAAICAHCGSRLTPGVKFCETCGKPAGSHPVPAAPVEPVEVPLPPVKEPAVTVPEPDAPEKIPDKKPGKKAKETGKKTQKKTPVPAEEKSPISPPGQTPVLLENAPDKPLLEKPVDTAPAPQAAAPVLPESEPPSPPVKPAGVVAENVPDRKIAMRPADTVQKTPDTAPASHARNLAIAGVIGLVIVAALAYLVLLPMLSGQSSAGMGSGFSLPGPNPAPSVIPTASALPAPSAVSFETKPTQRMPSNLEVTYQAERNNINGLVTVTFAGGPGMNGVSQTVVTLTKSDGTVETKTFKPKQTGDSVTLQGTLKTDRLEVIANYYTGDSYRVIDQLFEYKKKN